VALVKHTASFASLQTTPLDVAATVHYLYNKEKRQRGALYLCKEDNGLGVIFIT
jgi:hypothetical protein